MENSQFIRSEMLIGCEAQKKLRDSRVIVFGLGGVGSYAAAALARAGVGHLALVDGDCVSPSNLNRQLCAFHSTIGMQKTQVMLRQILDINPDCDLEVFNTFYLPENADEIPLSGYDYIADAIDTVSAKIELALRAQSLGVPIISCMGTGNKLDACAFTVSDIYDTRVCPLCRVMRRELKVRGVSSLRVVWSPEEPLKPQGAHDSGEKRAVPGSLPFVPPVAGMLMAGEIIKNLAGCVSQ